ncbi:MAG: hypothetical protein H6759_03635 [Candidatus Nomurabacteria bacterium]|nr:MAG: hypothetical protein H6759_03635 [Candidatus Nomurabacteria bacterium]
MSQKKKTPYISIDGTLDYPSYELCDYSDAYTVPEERGTSPESLRLVDAGDGYRETFYRIHTPLLMRDLGYTPTLDTMRTSITDNTISYFKIEPTVNGEVGRLACGYNAEWANNVPSVDYKDQSSLSAGESIWRTDVNSRFDPFLTRANEVEIRDSVTDQWKFSDCLAERQPERISGKNYQQIYEKTSTIIFIQLMIMWVVMKEML